ncbi:uncharacterized protein TEOVI_000571600 [Trypanosoma equiperdum]|uniref:Uncharacterized protein n=3 Tax=Trypanozoon TaxID=39700 RepID=Q381U2_TRYB2|nr:hypothetical protein, conserved [Trypanosoma brucei brucei TREU927]EAN80439.1 hypothetical protein, conserved [Trypanosoma brucei brucei TREU927]SCU65688.1 hypothetical protein, conserved [Trypanosoma equiperdum]
MDREKLAWAGLSIVSVVFFLYIQNSSPRRSRGLHRPRGTRASPPRPVPNKYRSGSTPGTAACRSEGSRSVVSSRPERTNGLTATSNNTFSSKHEPSAHPQESRTNGENTPARHPHWLTRISGSGLNSAARSRRPSTATAPYMNETPQRRERGTQTTDAAFRVVNENDALVQMVSTDALRCISPIPRQGKETPSPLSQDVDLCLGYSLLGGEKLPSFLLSPALDGGVARELMELIEAVQNPEVDPKEWLELYNFLTELPRSVLCHILKTRKIPELAPPLLTARSPQDKRLTHLSRLQQEVFCLLRGERGRYSKIGRFAMDEREAIIIWCPAEGKATKYENQFHQFTILSSDDDDSEDKDNADDLNGSPQCVRVAEAVEKILLRRRRAKMPSSATQFPESSSVSGGETMWYTNSSFEEAEVATLLKQLMKLRHHEAFSVLQRNGTDYSFILNLLSLSTNAQSMLERSILKKKQRARAKVGAPSSSTSSPSITPSGKSGVKPHEQVGTRSNGMSKHTDVRQYEEPNLNEELSILLDKTPSSSFNDGKEGFMVSKKLFGSERNGERTPRRKGVHEHYARVSTTSTVPSPLDNIVDHKILPYGRMNTHAHVEMNGDNSISSGEGSNFRQKKSVYDRLYTPPKKTVKPAATTSSWAKAPFNVYV